jgi:flagellar hook protein FlgE
MYSGVAGLKTHQTKMDVIGNNIANVNTVAYKSQSVTFSELMYQTTQSASGANATTGTGGVNARQIGLGVKTGAINTAISTQGASQTTNNPFDIMITGDAFFIVNNGSQNYFTRDGSFYVDGAGNLAMTSNGYNVMGWGVDEETQTIRKDNVTQLRIMSPDNLTYPPEATSKAYLSGIIDKNDTNVTSSSGKNVNLQFYDNLGYSYTARLNIKSTDTEGIYTLELNNVLDENNDPIELGNGFSFGDTTVINRETSLTLGDGYQWDADHKVLSKLSDGSTVFDVNNQTDEGLEGLATAYGKTVDELKNYKVTLSKAGDADTTAAVSVYDILTDAEVTGQGGAKTRTYYDISGLDLDSLTSDKMAFSGFTLTYDTTTGVFKGVNGNAGVDTLSINLSEIDSRFSNIEVDLSTTTMYNNSGSSTIAATSGDTDGLGTGRKLGEMSGISIQQDGTIYASYDNGQTKLLGQIAVAEFANASGLEKEGDNLYSATLNSGEFDGIGVDITSSGGYMNTGVLEMSNVDLSSEFTEMITTQRGFQANSRIITVSDTLLEELVNLKR